MRRPYLTLSLGSLLIAALDLWTKAVAVRELFSASEELPRRYEDFRSVMRAMELAQESVVIPVTSWFNFRLAGNPGAAWGIFRNLSEAWRVPFFVTISAIVIVILLAFFRQNKELPLVRWALTLVLGGAIGNLVDRIRFGYVIDFIDWHHDGWHFPTFNVADIAITVGLGLLIIDTIRQELQLRRLAREQGNESGEALVMGTDGPGLASGEMNPSDSADSADSADSDEAVAHKTEHTKADGDTTE